MLCTKDRLLNFATVTSSFLTVTVNQRHFVQVVLQLTVFNVHIQTQQAGSLVKMWCLRNLEDKSFGERAMLKRGHSVIAP